MNRKAAAIAAVMAVTALAGCSRSESEPVTTAPPIETVVITEETTVTTTETTAETTTETESPETEPTVTTTEEGPRVQLPDLDSYVRSNSDTAGWINVPGTFINNAVVQCDNNDYYLNHNFDGGYSEAGWIFADYRGVVNDFSNKQCDNIILYGPNQANGTMFGTLQYYKVTHQNTSRFDFYLEHPTFEFSNLYHQYTYKIVAVFVLETLESQVRDGKLFDYQNYIIFGKDSYTYEEWIEQIMSRTEIDTGVDV